MATKNLLDAPVGATLRELSVPMAVGVVFMLLVNLIDTYWASRLGTDALAAMSFAFPVIGVVLNVSIGLMIGTSVAVARMIGAGDERTSRRLATHSLILAFNIVVVVTIVGLLTQDYVFRALGAPEHLLGVIDSYMVVWYLSAIFLVVPMMLNGVLRAHGDAITARNVMILAAVFNGILDPIFIFGWGPVPAYGLQGAAIATGISRALTFVYALVVAMRMNSLHIHIPGPSELWRSSKIILQVGIPATLTNVLGPVATAVITAIVAVHGSEAVAAYGIGARLEALLLIPLLALSSGLSPFIGQNWGAHLGERVREAFSLSVRFSVAWGIFAAIAMLLSAPWIAQIFTDDASVAADIVLYLRIVPFGYAGYGIILMVSSGFNAVDHASRATVLSVLRSIVLAIPFAYVGSLFAGLTGIFAGLAIASVLAAVVGGRWMRTFLTAEVRADVVLPAGDAGLLIAGTVEAHRPATQALITHLLSLEKVELHRTRADAVGFFVGYRELGHIHPSGHLDIPLPHPIGDALVDQGILVHHRMQDGGWYSHDLREVHDTEEAEWLLALAHAIYVLVERGPEDPVTVKELADLNLEGPVADRLSECSERWHPKAVAA